MHIGGLLAVKHKPYQLEGVVGFPPVNHGGQCNLGSLLQRVAEGAGAQRRKRYAGQAIFSGKLQ